MESATPTQRATTSNLMIKVSLDYSSDIIVSGVDQTGLRVLSQYSVAKYPNAIKSPALALFIKSSISQRVHIGSSWVPVIHITTTVADIHQNESYS